MAQFIDLCNISVKAGNGGNGIISFRKEAHVPKGGPDGGDGGKGGDVILVGEGGTTTLLHLKYKKVYKAEPGANGMSKKQHGRGGKNSYVKVPIGTIIKDKTTGRVLCDIIKDGQEVVIARGGTGGKGNTRFANSRNKAPRLCENGDLGEKLELTCELKVLADVGLVGLPSVGKSTFITSVTNSRPKIADYHFTTLVPNLGVTQSKDGRSFVIADLPGLIEGASLGKGLGHQFLKHIERCRVIVHVVDMTAEYDQYEEYLKINKELRDYDPKIMEKPMLICANKMDEDISQVNLEKFKKHFDKDLVVYETTALIREGFDPLLYKIADILEHERLETNDIIDDDEVVMNYKFTEQNEAPFKIHKLSNDTWEVYGRRIENICHKIPLSSHQNILRFNDKIKALGVFDGLREAGAMKGDTVMIGDHVMEMNE